MLLSYCHKTRKRKLKSKSEIEIKMDWHYLDNHPFEKKIFKINFRMKNQKLKSYFGYPPPMPNEI